MKTPYWVYIVRLLFLIIFITYVIFSVILYKRDLKEQEKIDYNNNKTSKNYKTEIGNYSFIKIINKNKFK